MKNILWYTRDGHLDFLARVSKRLEKSGNKIKSYYVCHNKGESDRLRKDYQVESSILSEYLNTRKNINISEQKIQELEKKYNGIPLRRLLWSEMHEKQFSEEKLISHLEILLIHSQ